MRFGLLITSVMAFSSSVFATSDKSINVLYRYDRSDDKHAIAAFDNTKLLIGYTCDYTLDHGSFSKEHVSFEVDEQANGNINVGGVSYPIHSKAEHSGGPTCTRIYNHKMVELDCTVAMDADFVGSPVAANATKACFGRDLASFDLGRGIRRMDTSKATTLEQRSPMPLGGLDGFKKVDKRCITEMSTEVAASVPQQQYFEQQFSVSSLVRPQKIHFPY